MINAPIGFEVSLFPDVGYASTLPLQLATLDADGTEIYVRVAATATAGEHADNVVLKSDGAIDATVTVSGEVKPIITPAVTIAQQNVGCPGDEMSFTATPTDAVPGSIYQWQINHVNTSECNSTFTSSSLSAGDVLTCIISISSPCSVPGISSDFVIQTSAVPVVSFSSDVTIKKGESITLNPVLPAGAFIYNWSPSSSLSDGAVSNPVASPTQTTNYTLKVTNTAGGCPHLRASRLLWYLL